MTAPHDLFMVTDKGLRIPIDLRFHHTEDGTRFWEPIIEADLDAVMPNVIAFDGPPLHRGEAITFPTPGPGWDTAEWGRRVMSNSMHVFGWYDDYENGVSYPEADHA